MERQCTQPFVQCTQPSVINIPLSWYDRNPVEKDVKLHVIHPSLAYALDVAINLDKWIRLKPISEDPYGHNTYIGC